jgi:ParB family chromosome partitioning protein
MGHVRALLGLKDEESMRRIAKQAIDQGLSVRKVEQLVKEQSVKKNTSGKQENIFIAQARAQMEEYFQTPVKIGSNSITIHFENEQDLTRIMEILHLVEEEA